MVVDGKQGQGKAHVKWCSEVPCFFVLKIGNDGRAVQLDTASCGEVCKYCGSHLSFEVPHDDKYNALYGLVRVIYPTNYGRHVIRRNCSADQDTVHVVALEMSLTLQSSTPTTSLYVILLFSCFGRHVFLKQTVEFDSICSVCPVIPRI